MTKKIKIYICPDANSVTKSKAIYAFEEIFWRFDISVQLSNELISADVIYSNAQPSLNAGNDKKQIWLLANFDLYEEDKREEKLTNVSLESIVNQVLESEVDPVAWVFRLLTLADERHTVRSRSDGNGNWSDLPDWRKSIAHLPVVEYLSLGLIELLRSRGIECREAIGLDQYKVLLTHDTDSTNSSQPFEMIYDFLKSIFRLEKRFFDKAYRSLLNINQPYHLNDHFGFERWLKAFPGYKHTFFISFKNYLFPHLNDVRSSASDKCFPRDLIKSISNSQHVEFGVHPGIRTKRKQHLYSNLKVMAESLLATPVIGVRHHYWSLDWKNPAASFRKMVNSGFRYDCTMTYPDRFGLRAGTCLPYRPYDPKYGRPLNISLIPTCVMDAWCMNISPDDKLKLKTMLNEIKRMRGVINLDWHTESAANVFPYEGYVDALNTLISESELEAQHSSLPFEIIKNWHAKIDALANLYPHLKIAKYE